VHGDKPRSRAGAPGRCQLTNSHHRPARMVRGSRYRWLKHPGAGPGWACCAGCCFDAVVPPDPHRRGRKLFEDSLTPA
jgi:hypothetical protein